MLSKPDPQPRITTRTAVRWVKTHKVCLKNKPNYAPPLTSRTLINTPILIWASIQRTFLRKQSQFPFPRTAITYCKQVTYSNKSKSEPKKTNPNKPNFPPHVIPSGEMRSEA